MRCGCRRWRATCASRGCGSSTTRPDRAAVRMTVMAGHGGFKALWFQYDSPRPGSGEISPHPALADIHLGAPPGSVIGLIGATGSGKSTLVSLIPRFYDVTRGRVTIDGI